MSKKSTSGESAPGPAEEIPAGDFSTWLAGMRKALAKNGAAEVACGECRACCDSSYFIHIRPEETGTLGRIDPRVLFDAPGMPAGNVLMGYDSHGNCPMLVEGKCSIYSDRPKTCRSYDCRIFVAAGVDVGGKEKSRIAQRVGSWRFAYPTAQDRLEHTAVMETAAFIQENADCFPGGAIPTVPSQLAILAIKTCGVLLSSPRGAEGRGITGSKRALARAIVQAAKEFDARIAGP
jgi:hypothetical protein